MSIKTHITKTEEGQVEKAVQIRSDDPGSPVSNQTWINTTDKKMKFYDGTSVVDLTLVRAGSLPNALGLVVGNATDVTNEDATHSSIAAAIAAASSGERITLLERTFTENLTVTKEVHLVGSGRNTVIDGTLQFSAGASYFSVERLKMGGNVTVDNLVVGGIIQNSWIAAGSTITDNNADETENLYLLMEE